MVLHGNNKGYLQLRSTEILQEYRANGYDVREVDYKSKNSVHEAFSSSMFELNPVLVLIHNPTKVKGLATYLKDPKDREVLVVYDKSSLPKLLKGFMTQTLNEPKYDNEKREWYSNFVKEYAKKSGKTISTDLCVAIVSKVGRDLGLLRYEVLKYVTLAGDEEEISPRMVAGVFCDLQGPESSDLIDAVIRQDRKGFLKVCGRIEKSSSQDQTMSVCNGLLFYTLKQLLDVSVRLEDKKSSETISAELGKNPWLVENILRPQALSLGLGKIILLIGVLYECEDSVLKGSRNPWVKFKTKMVSVL
jgi:DNA polymerase III delta subunit